MLHRADEQGIILVSQPAHAWIAEQLARAWGNEQFGVVEPRREVYAAAGQHDIGWLDWETHPHLNPDIGRPYTFMNMPTMMHVDVWSPAGQLALPYGRYAALLVSLHGTNLYKRHDFSRDTPDEAAAARAFMQRGAEFEQDLIEQLRSDVRYRTYATDEAIDRNRRLVGVWDGMSLAICMGIEGQRQFDSVPSAASPLSITFESQNETTIRVDPWPFQAPSLSLYVEGRRLNETFSDEEAMQSALAAAPWVGLNLQLRKR